MLVSAIFGSLCCVATSTFQPSCRPVAQKPAVHLQRVLREVWHPGLQQEALRQQRGPFRRHGAIGLANDEGLAADFQNEMLNQWIPGGRLPTMTP